METIKGLIGELHRRALWQVLVIFLVGSWLVLQIVRVLTETVGLPEWTPRLALVLLLIGLPFTLAAAFVREGTPGHGSALGGVLQELHRRSLWQVLGLFLAGSWGALQVVELLTQTAGLPDWTPTMALVLLLIGLPFCLATAFVQEGMPGGEEADPSAGALDGEPIVTSGSGVRVSASTDSLERSTTGPSKTRALLTWRHALLGGIGAFALLGFSLFAYFVMWSTGFGPVGNLVAQGVFTEGERVILADFADETGEGLGYVVTEALRIDLLEASILDLVEDAEIAPTLALMQVEPGTVLTAARAQDVALRNGIAAVLEGEVASAGSGYIISATLRATESGRSLSSFRVSADGPDGVIGGIDQLSQDIREKSGESLRTIRAGKPLEQVTTSSLDALKLYTEAMLTPGEGPWHELLEQAVVRDSTFAMAWRALSLARGVVADPVGSAEALNNAFRHRHRLQDAERYVVEALYYSGVDETRAMEAYENTLRLNPTEPRALNNLSVIYTRRFDLEHEEELLRRAVDSPERNQIHYSNLVRNQLSFGRIDEAAAILRDFEEAYPGDYFAVLARFRVLFAQGNLDAAADHARERSNDENLGRLAYWAGRLDEARSLFLRAEVVGGQRSASLAWNLRLDTAYEEALVGDAEWARGHVRDGLESTYATLPPSGRGDLGRAIGLSVSGNPEAADRLLQDWEDATPEERRGPTTRARVERASLQARVERGDTARAVETMQRLLLEWGCSDACWPFERARLHDRLNEPEQAIEQYERVRQPGYPDWATNTGQRLHAMLRLGPLYEELGDTTKAIEAYQRMVDQWADGDARGQETVRRFRERITALGG